MNNQEIKKAIEELKDYKGDVLKETISRQAVDLAISALEHQLTNGWIPVSKRLPEENGHYLVTYHEWSKGEYIPEFDFTCVKILRFYHGEFKMPVCCNDKIEQDIGREVLAWRELPDPYKEVSE